MTEQEIKQSLPWVPAREWEFIYDQLEFADEEDQEYYLGMPNVRIFSPSEDRNITTNHDLFEFRPGVAEFITKACNNFHQMLEALNNLENDNNTIHKALWNLVVKARSEAGGRQDGDTPKAIFNYPQEFTSLSDYTLHRGAKVEILRPMMDGAEYDYEGELLYEVRASDGWIGHAFESELERIQDNA
jgi:hypothetical protein